MKDQASSLPHQRTECRTEKEQPQKIVAYAVRAFNDDAAPVLDVKPTHAALKKRRTARQDLNSQFLIQVGRVPLDTTHRYLDVRWRLTDR